GLNFRSRNVLFGSKLAEYDEQGEPLDLGFVGDVTHVDRAAIDAACSEGRIPVIPSMCVDERTGQKLNVNADTAASAIAESLAAEKLVFLSDVNGVRARKEDPESLIQSLTAAQARELIHMGRIESGMIPKVESCLRTLERGVHKVHIVDGRLRHSLLLEVYTNRGVGTQFVR
ncbi:MAG TPA: acetylglutamate kinase, partial [Pirellulaceae bacterium]